jgi:branched-chain amino acid aminotransferase
VGSISYDFDAVRGPTVVILARPFEPPPESVFDNGIAACIAGVRRNARDAIDPAIKTSSLVNNILAMREAQQRGAVEPLLLNGSGEVAEGAGSNVFAVHAGKLSTPPLDAGILEGITRALTFELAAARSIPLQVRPLRPDDLRTADELFVTSTTKELMPVATLDERPVGDGKPGPITRQLLHDYRSYAARTAA